MHIPVQVKRVYDIIPNNRGLVLDGPLARSMKVCPYFYHDRCLQNEKEKNEF